MKNIDIAFSTCPNDTFIFHAMMHGLIDTKEFEFKSHFHDIEELNKKAFNEVYEVTKLSFYAYFLLKDKYELLETGAALGYGCGPILVANSKSDFKDIKNPKIAVPGEFTTALLLLKLWKPEIKNIKIVRFDKILPGVKENRYDAGLVIHEGRFVYEKYDCKKIIDLGSWWEQETIMPIPLGCIAIRKDLAQKGYKKDIETIIKNSINYAYSHKDASKNYIKKHAQEIDDEVILNHIDLYVNDFSISLGKTGTNAVNTLYEMAKCKKII